MRGTPGQTLDQRRARHAWDAVSAAREQLKQPLRESYAREAKRLPVRIRTAGLGHALAFLAAKESGSNANGQLLRDLDDWVLCQRRPSGLPRDAKRTTEAIVQGDSAFLQLATDEVLAWLQWLTRFSEAEFGGGEE